MIGKWFQSIVLYYQKYRLTEPVNHWKANVQVL